MKNPNQNLSSKFSENDGEKLRTLFVDGLKDLYWAENHLAKALPKMSKAATSEDLKIAFETHHNETEKHVNRLERIFEIIGEKIQAKKCPAMEGLLQEGDEIVNSTETRSFVRDCGLIMAAQKVEHYEIASYGTLRNIARILGYFEVAEILQTTLDEEGEADHKLTELAEAHINEEAALE
ncbi:ferritin-like domain-containing protein [Emticicia sp. BO119]|uniref:YciE/YciF ferroxidase family protein n=1 Tax=Emticicia sp. BO119 TaxID=2757768 RepID=UPI0015F06BEC|nr:ferritin-like domain-containing protein [Emticicia sp. BO119]MBA4850133.1 ferritin-like domain-containing protein [Emticicia sp. BO119]